MGYLTFFGNLFIAFGPAAALFFWVISRSSRLIILTIGSSFFWLLSMLLDSIWWFVIPPLRNKYWWTIPWSILFQESFRFIFYKLYIDKSKAEKGFSDSQSTAHLTTHPDNFKAALAFGWGIGVTHGAVYFATLLWQSVGSGNYFSDACPSVNIFLILEFCFILYHILWSVVAFDGFREKNKMKLASVILCHLFAAFLTMINLVNCAAGVVLQFVLLGAYGALTWFILMKTTSLTTTRSTVQVLH